MLQRLQAQGIPVVAVFLSGRPLYVTPEINASIAFVAAWQPGSEGEGVADMLFSNADGSVAYDFRGRLSFSWPRSPDQYDLNVGSEPYYPLFPFGYGLTYGAPTNIGKLPEAVSLNVARLAATGADSGGVAGSAERRVLFENGETSTGWIISAGGKQVETRTSLQGLTTSRSASGIDASWSSQVPVSLTITGQPINFIRENERGMSLSMTVRVDKAPSSPVVLAMGCGPLCGGKLDVTDVMREAMGRGPMTMSVPLSCLRAAGTDLSNVPTPFALTTSGSFSVALSEVRIAREPQALSCAAVPPVTAAAAVPAGSRRDFYVQSSHGSKKKKSGEAHERKKRSSSTQSTDHKRTRHKRR